MYKSNLIGNHGHLFVLDLFLLKIFSLEVNSFLMYICFSEALPPLCHFTSCPGCMRPNLLYYFPCVRSSKIFYSQGLCESGSRIAMLNRSPSRYALISPFICPTNSFAIDSPSPEEVRLLAGAAL